MVTNKSFVVLGVPPMTLSLLLGCTRLDNSGPAWAARADSSEFRPVTRAPEVCTTCIRVEPIVFLGDTAGAGSLEVAGLNVVRDSSGDFWVSQRQGLMVFGPTGAFERRIGRAGGGPLEFQAIPIPVHTDSQGRVRGVGF